jgi:hypothetical protein
LLNHLIDRITDREISADQLGQFADWLVAEPEVPDGRWFKRFSGMIVCGEASLVKTFLRSGPAYAKGYGVASKIDIIVGGARAVAEVRGQKSEFGEQRAA